MSQDPLKFVVSTILVLFFMGFVIFALQGGHLTKLGARFGGTADSLSNALCSDFPSLGSFVNDERPPDLDGDGHPDACDICQGGDDRISKDGDGIPDDCEPEEESKTSNARTACVQKCKELKKKNELGQFPTPDRCWDKDNFRCTLPCVLDKTCPKLKSGISIES
ncbi:MAG: hypothetical protein QGG83_00460 [Candidatus Woesearchaeota archaeon]|jgi:hypothetical protein|nr:hypothetical protein [Candidatus Woesearchaeota archaeon]MDP7647037.1 hypothetical protein [Candidatus Woesearchaeota archaeon]